MVQTRTLSRAKTSSVSVGNRKVISIGDLRSKQGVNSVGDEYSKLMEGWQTWLQFLTDQRFEWSVGEERSGISYASPYTTTASILAAINGIISTTDARTAIVMAGAYDFAGGVDFATASANMTTIIGRLQDTGFTVIVVAETPRGDAVNTGARLASSNLKSLLRYSEWLRSLRTSAGVFVADPWPLLSDEYGTTGDFSSSEMAKDGILPSATGAYWIAQSLAPIIRQIFPPVDLLPSSSADVYDETHNPQGCLNSNPMMSGAGGSYHSNGGSGQVADGWSEGSGTLGASWTRTYAKSQLSNGKPAQEIRLGGWGTTEQIIFSSGVLSGAAADDYLYAVAAVEIDPNVIGMSEISLQLSRSAEIAGAMRRRSSSDKFPNVSSPIWGVMRTPRFLVTNNPTLQLSMYAQAGALPSGTIRIGQVAVRKEPT